MPSNDFWLLLVANLPIVTVLFIALQKKIIVMGVTFDRENDLHQQSLSEKDQEIEFREKLRQEAIADRDLLRIQDKEKTEALRELTVVVKQSLELNDRLLNESLAQRWDGNDRRSPKTSRGT